MEWESRHKESATGTHSRALERKRKWSRSVIAYQAPPSMEFSRQEYWNGLPFPSPGDLSNPGLEPASPALAGSFFTTEPTMKPPCLKLGNELSKERHALTKQKTLLESGVWAESSWVREPENCSATDWLTVSGFMVMGLVSGLSLASRLAWPMFGLTQGPSCWHMHLSAKMDSSMKDFGRLVGHMDFCLLPPFVKVLQSYPTVCNPMDYHIVHGILQARILEWVALPFSRGSSQPRDWTWVSHIEGGFFTSWATGEALLLAPPKFSWLVFSSSTVLLYQDLLWNSSCKWLLLCLANMGGTSINSSLMLGLTENIGGIFKKTWSPHTNIGKKSWGLTTRQSSATGEGLIILKAWCMASLFTLYGK